MTKQASIKDLQNEVRKMAQTKGFPISPKDKLFLIDRIQKELDELKHSEQAGEPNERIAEEATDVFIQCIQLILALGLSPDEVYRRKMDQNWGRTWQRQTNGEFKSQ